MVRKSGYHTTIVIPVEENRMTTVAVEFPVSNGTADTDVLPSQETDTKWVIRGKIFETDFQQTPVSRVKVRITGGNLEHSKIAYSNAGGEYEFALLPGSYSIFLDKDGYEGATGRPGVFVDSRQSSVTVIKEGMFVVYEAVAKGNVLALKHGISKRSFSERHRERIQEVSITIIGSILGVFILWYLDKRRQKHSQE